MVFSFIFSMCGSVVAMMEMIEKIKKFPSELVISRKQAIAGAIGIPLIIGSCVVLYKSDFMPSLPDVLKDSRVLGAGKVVASMSALYLLANRFNTQERFTQYNAEKRKIAEHKIFKQKKIGKKDGDERSVTVYQMINECLQIEDDEDAKQKLQALIRLEFSGDVHRDCPSTIKATREIGALVDRIKKAKMIVKNLSATYIYVHGYDESTGQVSCGTINIDYELTQFKKKKEFLKNFRAKIFSLPQYQEEKKQQPDIERNRLEKEKMAWSNKVGTFASFFAGPAFGNLFTIFVQYIFNLLGSEKVLPLQQNAPAALFVNNTMHRP